MKVYSKNYHIKGIGTIGGKEVSAKIDAALDNALANVKKKAADFHSEVKAPKKAKATE